MSQQYDMEDANYYDQYMESQNDYYQDYGLDLVMTKKSSGSQNYMFCSTQKIQSKIDSEIQLIQNMTCLSYSWAYQLYSECLWQMSTIYKLLDVDASFKSVISYNADFNFQQNGQQNLCDVCCEEGKMLKNSCGHSFCFQCWKMMLETSIFVSSQLFPKCQGDQCEQKMNFQLTKFILKQSTTEELKNKYLKLKVLLYSRYNSTVKVCPNPRCQKKFIINDLSLKPIICLCGFLVCAYCGEKHHYPINCSQKQNWGKISRELQKQWIDIIQYKICPRCQEPIQKNQGCNHMTCRCKHQFCWICLQNWKTHGVCKGMQAHQKMQKQRKKMLDNQKKYRQRFELAHEKYVRFSNYEKRVEKIKIDQLAQKLKKQFQYSPNYFKYLEELKKLLLIGVHFLMNSSIYDFFRGKQAENTIIIYTKRIQAQTNQLDDYLQKLKTNCEAYQNFASCQAGIRQTAKQNSILLIEGKLKQEIVQKISITKQFIMKILQRK